MRIGCRQLVCSLALIGLITAANGVRGDSLSGVLFDESRFTAQHEAEAPPTWQTELVAFPELTDPTVENEVTEVGPVGPTGPAAGTNVTNPTDVAPATDAEPRRTWLPPIFRWPTKTEGNVVEVEIGDRDPFDESIDGESTPVEESAEPQVQSGRLDLPGGSDAETALDALAEGPEADAPITPVEPDAPLTVDDPAIVVDEAEIIPTPLPRVNEEGVQRLPPIDEPQVVPTPDNAPPVAGDFPRLPPDPNLKPEDALPPLADELYVHGGSYLYQDEGDRLGWPSKSDPHTHYDLLRLPEDWQKPRPVEGFAEFLGSDPPAAYPDQYWRGPFNYMWEPRFVGYGNYRVFGLAFEENDREQHGIGHQLELEFDLRLTGTERFHVQLKPIGFENTGGSFYQFTDPSGYVDNSSARVDRYWFEGELHSMLGGTHNPFAALDYHIVVGRFPFALHNNLLMNTDLLGGVVNKNTIYCGQLSNLNIQVFAGREDVAAFRDATAIVAGTHVTADWRHVFIEASYVHLRHEDDRSRDAHFIGTSATRLVGPWTFAARKFAKFGDEGGSGDGHLFVLESNFTRYWDHQPCGIKYGVFYCNGFYASEGWNPVAGGNFDRLRSSFEVNPLVAISAGNPIADVWGASLGVQLFRHHEDESFVPEIAFQEIAGEAVYGAGIRYQLKTGPRTFFEVLGTANFSDLPQFDRRGVLVSETIVF